MASSGGVGFITEPPTPPPTSSSQEVFQWLKNLPLAPEYHPTPAEFQDPIAYIFKIEKEASKYGICKIVPPLLSSSKKATITNLNRSLAARSASNSPTFTTRQQQIGFCPRKPRPVQKPVWQSGEYYTFQEFEAKAKSFEKNYLKNCSKKGQGGLSPLEIETLYWKATVDKPFSVEYANDMPGSAFSAKRNGGGGGGEGVTVGETEWNMRGVSRAKGSLLRFMKEEIPGVTSPMVYIAMLFSWFAWHVEDHDLHSLNYLHMGAGKTWYGVPREAAVAFEEVVRVHGYGGEFNPLVTFAVLGEKTTVISPEVFIGAGVPCCRLVQNAGEFVVTFPRAYHSGFSHGFNCGEAANIATPEWLRVAKDAAIRRASINYPPMVSHFQLLYDLALELCARIPMSISSKPRSSRLKDKQKGEGETLIKDLFVKNVAHNSGLLHRLGSGSSVVILPHSSSVSLSSNLRVRSQLNLNASLGLSNHKGFMKSLKSPVPYNIMSDHNSEVNPNKGFFTVKGKFDFVYEQDKQTENMGSHGGSHICGDKLSDQRLFSCVTCGVLSFDCVAIIQPSEGAARYLMSADCNFFNDWIVGSGVTSDKTVLGSRDVCTFQQTSSTRLVGTNGIDGLYDTSVQSSNHLIRTVDQNVEAASNDKPWSEGSALGLLAVNYGDSSDSEEDHCDPDVSHDIDETNLGNTLESEHHLENSSLLTFKQEFHDIVDGSSTPSVSRVSCKDEVALQTMDFHANDGRRVANLKDTNNQSPDRPVEFETDHVTSMGIEGTFRGSMPLHFSSVASLTPRSDEDSCCMHVFCLEHAIEVEQQLHSIGGAQILLLCHPEYPRIEAEAKLLSKERGIDYIWNEIAYRDATEEDEERIKLALDIEEAIPGNGDWAVKLGINLFYSANLSQSSLYIKQMPYNSVIYNAFGHTSPARFNVYTRRPARQRKVVAGRWCGKVWMSNQVHPLLAKQDHEDQEQERSCLDLATAGENLEQRAESIQKSRNTSVTRKSARKRKMASRGTSVKKFKCLETEDALSDHSAGYDSCKQPMKTYSRRKTKFVESKVSYGSEDSSHQNRGKIHRTKQVTPVERDDAVLDGSFKKHFNRPYRKSLIRKEAQSSERDNVVTYNLAKSSHRQHRRISKQAKLVERESAASDDSFEDAGHGWQGRVQRIRQAKFIEREDVLSDDSPGDNSHWLHGRSKQVLYTEKEDSASGSDDLPDDSLLHQLRRVPRGNNFKFIEREDAVSDDSVEEDTCQQQVRLHRSKLGKFVEREDGVSDDNSDQQPKIRGSKCKVVEWGDGLLDDDVNQSRRRIPRNEKANFSESEDAVSDDSLEDITQKQHARVPKGKRARYTDSEDEASDDLVQNNIYQQSRELPRGKKQAKYFEREEAVSDDLLEESNQQKSKILRSRRKKPITLGLTKRRKNSQLVKQGTQRSIKKEPSRSIKLERQIKHETPQPRKNKQKQNARDYDSNEEEEQEGGPSTRLRKRPSKPSKDLEMKTKEKLQSSRKTAKNMSAGKPVPGRKNLKVKDEETEYQCDIEGCTMGFDSKQDLALHKRNICPVKGCGKKFFSHKYLVQHRRVHLDDRPLKCPWKGCKMTFKWAWARTEHIRVHTGARPYICSEEGCGQTFRFVSDFSRHKRKTGHAAKKTKG